MSDKIRRPPAVSFRSVSKLFGNLRVLHNLDLDVVEGEHISLIGPSGSGKSTVLRVLMTLETIQEGQIIVHGRNLWDDYGKGSVMSPHASEIRRQIGMVFQSFNLFPHMTALHNIAEAPMRVLRLSKDEAMLSAEELLAMVGLSEKRNSYPAQLSGGQQQRVAIARCLAMRPKILLFDEVTSALDPETVGEVLAVIRRLASEQDFTILMVTHQMNVAREISDRILFLHGGRILEDGPPEQILDDPREDRTRSFLRAIREA